MFDESLKGWCRLLFDNDGAASKLSKARQWMACVQEWGWCQIGHQWM